MRLAPLSALLLLAACGGPAVDVYEGGGPTFPVPWVEDDVMETGGPDGGTADAGTADAGPWVPSTCTPASCPVEVLATGQQSSRGLR